MDKRYRKIRSVYSKVEKWRNLLLRQLDIELTDRCNNNCIHCYINRPENDSEAASRELSTNELQALLGEAADCGCLMVRFTGGEPFLREDFFDIYRHARKLGLVVAIFSNATRISDSVASELSALPPLAPMEISLYGPSPSVHDAVTRVPGSFEAALRGIERLTQNRVPFVLKGVAMRLNHQHIEAMHRKLIGWSYRKKPPSWVTYLSLRTRRDSQSANRRIRKERLSPRQRCSIHRHIWPDWERSSLGMLHRLSTNPGRRLFPCDAGKQHGCVDAYGRLLPCLLVRQPEAALDLKRTSLRNALEIFFPDLRLWEAADPTYLRRCGGCFLYAVCDQCPGQAWAEHGALDVPVDYHCAVAHESAQRLGLLQKGEKAWEMADGPDRVRRMLAEKNIEGYETKKEDVGSLRCRGVCHDRSCRT